MGNKKIDLKAMRKQLEAKRKEVVEGVSRAREMGSVETESGAPDNAKEQSPRTAPGAPLFC